MIEEFTLAANESKVLPGGYCIAILESTQEVTIERLSANGGRLEVAENVPASWFWKQPVWTRDPTTKAIKVTAGSLGAAVKISVSDGDSWVNTISGVVSVTNADKERTEAGVAFLQGYAQTPVVGEYGYIVLANPAASGKNLVVNMVVVCQPAGSSGDLQLAITEDYAAFEAEAATTLQGSFSPVGASKKIGVGSSVVSMRRCTTTAFTPVNITALSRLRVIGEPFPYDFTEPYIVPEGCGIAVRTYAANEELQANFEWFEEDA